MKIKHFTHVLLASLLLIGVFSAYGVWYIVTSKKSAEARTLAMEIQTKKQDSERIKAAKDELQKLSAEESTINGYYVATSDVVPFLESLQSTGKSLGSKVQVVSVSADASKPHAHLNLSLSITGPFDSVLRTLGALEYSPYDAVLQNLTFDTPQVGVGKAGQWTAAATYFVGTTDAPKVPTITAPVARSVPLVTSTTTSSATTSTTVASTTKP